ncbi:hypothetical protein MGG_07447 [Pyricularia oryzae 70-15]|uniref:Uncharacterized protein n=3 Tax=Pyricularia oryzae TaxID=318829 RepID=G4N159_PYRO7|nr:uncharacterized protein MGG_07447 [Pyricularia oryzae 70-15]EHA51538.1 hypothetical protein MGG_07447 [Pyricularia oryzae 70-15]ELQ38138.1 hypothetical protein OOU_Y34scaffold00552g93 [Pyricularia oryzae Y34]
MTDQAHGSSLLQAREAAHLRRHTHNHNRIHRRETGDDHHRHLHQHRRHLQQHNQHVRPHADSPITPPPSQQPQRRQLPDAVESIITEVVRTVSVIQYVDGGGLPVAISTVFSPALTPIIDPITDITVDNPLTNLPLPTLPTPPVPKLSSSSSASGNGSGGSVGVSPPLQTGSLSSSSRSLHSVTATPSSAPPLPTTRPGIFNSTSSARLFNNTTIRSHFFNSSSISATSLSTSTLSETTITSSTSISLTSTSFTTSRTADVAGGFVPNGAIPSPTSAPTHAAAGPASAPPPTETLVGGVVGGICGMALLLFAVVFILRWRRQQMGNHKMLADGTGNSGDGSKGFSSRMSERGIPFAVPAALAALSGKKAIAPAEGEERGFVRVSGRKLPSVLHHGGDGYTNPFSDPRDSTISGGDQSIMYRDSQMFFSPPLGSGPDSGFSPGGSRLKLGSPMRPESGIPVIQPGPARTPVQEGIPAFPVSPPTTTALRPPPSPLPNQRDPLGRSHPSQDGSRASRLSQSRFTENMA